MMLVVLAMYATDVNILTIISVEAEGR